MKIVLATGIYPPDIGGPATYVECLAREFSEKGNEVRVVTYGGIGLGLGSGGWKIFWVAKHGGPLVRWWRYSRALKQHAADADVVVAFSSVSVGVPLWLSGLKIPKRILRLGGDFLWERYTDRGGMKGLREWYNGVTGYWLLVTGLMGRLLRQFDHIVFSTRFQEELYEKQYRRLSPYSVIENPSPSPSSSPSSSPSPSPSPHLAHQPFRLLFMGRFVGFKNLFSLIHSIAGVHELRLREGAAGTDQPQLREGEMTLTMVGDGPLKEKLQVVSDQRQAPVAFLPPVSGADKQKIFAEHDLLVLPSLTEISPNVALEARATGLPVLLTSETGLSEALRQGMIIAKLRTPEEIRAAIMDVRMRYPEVAKSAGQTFPERSWQTVAEEYIALFKRLA